MPITLRTSGGSKKNVSQYTDNDFQNDLQEIENMMTGGRIQRGGSSKEEVITKINNSLKNKKIENGEKISIIELINQLQNISDSDLIDIFNHYITQRKLITGNNKLSNNITQSKDLSDLEIFIAIYDRIVRDGLVNISNINKISSFISLEKFIIYTLINHSLKNTIITNIEKNRIVSFIQKSKKLNDKELFSVFNYYITKRQITSNNPPNVEDSAILRAINNKIKDDDKVNLNESEKSLMEKYILSVPSGGSVSITRRFKIDSIKKGNNLEKVTFDATTSIKPGSTPLSAARKLLTSYCEKTKTPKSKVNIVYTIREITRDYKKGFHKVYGPYSGKYHMYTNAEKKEAKAAGVSFSGKPVVKKQKALASIVQHNKEVHDKKVKKGGMSPFSISPENVVLKSGGGQYDEDDEDDYSIGNIDDEDNYDYENEEGEQEGGGKKSKKPKAKSQKPKAKSQKGGITYRARTSKAPGR
jgi:hypothetical protein